MKTSKYFYTIVVCIMCVSCTDRKASKPEAKKQEVAGVVTLSDVQVKNAGIQTGRVDIRTMGEEITVNGVVDVPPQSTVSVSFPIGGYFKSTRLLPGMRVSKGQILAMMEDQTYIQLQQDYLVTKTKLAALKEDYNRQKMLNATKTSSDKTFQMVESDYRTQQIGLKALGEKLLMLGVNPRSLSVDKISRSIPIRCPIDGFVMRVNANIGSYVNPSDVLFELVNTDDLHLALTVFEKDLNLIHPGAKVTAHLTSDTSRVYKGEVILVGRGLDENRSTAVHCHFTGRVSGLVPGMFLQAQIETSGRKVTAVREDAVVRYGNKEYIFVAEGKNRFRQLEVKTGKTENGFTEVKSDESSLGDRVIVTANAYSILMKMKNAGDEE